jgi:uncharacterized protein (DUF2249 family)
VAAIRTVSQFEQRVFSSVVEDVYSIGFDRVKSTIPDSSVRYDSIDLDLAKNFIEGAKRLFVASATTELGPSPFFGRVRKEAQEYSNRCRFGHTFRGSFGFTIESPIEANAEPTLLPEQQIAPFERRVVQRLVRGFQMIERAERDENVSIITDGYRSGFNANMCEDFAELIENTTDTIRFQVLWSPEWRPPPDLVGTSTFEVHPNTLEIVSAAASSLRRQETNLPRTVVGRVIRLRSDHDPSDLLDTSTPREINLIWESEEFGPLNIRITLERSDYIKAVEAHKSGKEVSVRGLLEKVGRSWFLSQPTEFAVVEK